MREFRGRACDYVVAVVGQPSVGKSTFFTRVTGEVVRIANWPGTTVDQKVGLTVFEGKTVCLVDLPGVYGLTPTSPEERITKNYLLSGDWDAILVLADSLTLERSVYLPIQIGEMTDRLVVALTKWDETHKRGLHVDVGKLSSRLGVPVIPVSSVTGEGIKQVLSALVKVIEGALKEGYIRIDYGMLESYLSELSSQIEKYGLRRVPGRWIALRLMEEDHEVMELVKDLPEVVRRSDELREDFKRATGKTPEEIAILRRYNYASQLLKDVVVRVQVRPHSTIDRVYLHPFLGPVVSTLTIFSAFAVAFTLNTGFPLTLILRHAGMKAVADFLEHHSISGLLELIFDEVGEAARPALEDISSELASLVVDGALKGVGSVLGFLPLILLVSALIAVLEDSGLGPRMVSSLHGFFKHFGLSGRALYPLIMGFGCNVPAVIQSRIAVDELERVEVMASAPFVLCQARLVVLLYFVRALFPGNALLQSAVMTSLYMISLLLYLLTAKALRRLHGIKEAPELIMEIPPIHGPNLRVVWWSSWSNARHFLYKAGVVILILSLLSWGMLSYGPTGHVESLSESYGAMLGSHVGWALEKLYGLPSNTSWMLGYALVYGFIAKEGLVSSIVQLTGLAGEEALSALNLGASQGVAVLTLMMFYVPCMVTVAVLYQESRSVRLTIAIVLYMLAVALALSLAGHALLTLITPGTPTR
ncbi:MAG: ferrous iron transport protein B [Zestosphaera sp.]